MPDLYLGLMSGTSLDGLDAVLADFSSHQPTVLGHCSTPLPEALRCELLALNQTGTNELHRSALAANALARTSAQLVHTLLSQCGIAAKDVRAIGAHGQTVRHRPQEFDGTGYTLQLNQPALLAELCGIDVVADFRSRDVAAGGQGAPLVPPFHLAFFGQEGHALAVLNLGGMSNLTLCPANDPAALRGFDCGPGNALLDAWCLAHTGAAFDANGCWAAGGNIQSDLLASLLEEPYFSLPAPKSTGRDRFNRAWLDAKLKGMGIIAARDVQATLVELTAQSCAMNLLGAQVGPLDTLIVCGGGALNNHLMDRLQNALPSCQVITSAQRGLPVMQVEATAFAWLARQAMHRIPASVCAVTGARHARILGALYPA